MAADFHGEIFRQILICTALLDACRQRNFMAGIRFFRPKLGVFVDHMGLSENGRCPKVAIL